MFGKELEKRRRFEIESTRLESNRLQEENEMGDDQTPTQGLVGIESEITVAVAAPRPTLVGLGCAGPPFVFSDGGMYH